MSPMPYALKHRGIIRIGGPDRRAFLQGLISNDINLCQPGKAIYAALLTPQGKFLHDLFVIDRGDDFLIDCEAARADDLLQRLTMYKLRAKVELENIVAAFGVWAIIDSESSSGSSPLAGEVRWGGHRETPQSGIVEAPLPQPLPRGEGRLLLQLPQTSILYRDPRHPALGQRLIAPKTAVIESGDFTLYDRHRLTLGIPDGSRDMIIGNSTLLECNLDRLNAISLTKGCYMGQELTARMHYRALVKKRLFPVTITGPAPAFGAIIRHGEVEIGDMRSSYGDVGLALLNVEKTQAAIENKTPLACGDAIMTAFIPDWLKL